MVDAGVRDIQTKQSEALMEMLMLWQPGLHLTDINLPRSSIWTGTHNPRSHPCAAPGALDPRDLGGPAGLDLKGAVNTGKSKPKLGEYDRQEAGKCGPLICDFNIQMLSRAAPERP